MLLPHPKLAMLLLTLSVCLLLIHACCRHVWQWWSAWSSARYANVLGFEGHDEIS